LFSSISRLFILALREEASQAPGGLLAFDIDATKLLKTKANQTQIRMPGLRYN
jgi:hypothetical protein